MQGVENMELFLLVVVAGLSMWLFVKICLTPASPKVSKSEQALNKMLNMAQSLAKIRGIDEKEILTITNEKDLNFFMGEIERLFNKHLLKAQNSFLTKSRRHATIRLMLETVNGICRSINPSPDEGKFVFKNGVFKYRDSGPISINQVFIGPIFGEIDGHASLSVIVFTKSTYAHFRLFDFDPDFIKKNRDISRIVKSMQNIRLHRAGAYEIKLMLKSDLLLLRQETDVEKANVVYRRILRNLASFREKIYAANVSWEDVIND